MVAKEESIGRGMEGEAGVDRCKLLYVYRYKLLYIYIPLYIQRVSNKTLHYSIENYFQYPMTNHNGKEHEKRIHIHM